LGSEGNMTLVRGVFRLLHMRDVMKAFALFAIAVVLSASWACGGHGTATGAAGAALPTGPSAVQRTYSGTVRAVDGGPLEGVKVTSNVRDAPFVLSDAAAARPDCGHSGIERRFL